MDILIIRPTGSPWAVALSWCKLGGGNARGNCLSVCLSVCLCLRVCACALIRVA